VIAPLKRKGVHEVEVCMQRKSGEQFFAHLSLSLLRDDSGAVSGMIGYALDITQRRHTEEALRASEERFRNLVETTNDWIWEINQDAVYTYASPQARDVLGYEPDELLGKTPFDLMPPEEARRVADIFGPIAAQRRPFTALENTNRRKDGQLVILETSGVPFLDGAGNFRGYRGIDRDITERKRVEEAIKARDAALESARLKSEFLANMSHEIRTPMNGVLGMLELLRGTELDGEQSDYAEAAHRSGEALLALLSDILDLSKIEAGGLCLEEVDFGLRSVVDEVLTLLGGRAYEKGLTLRAEVSASVPDRVRGDPTRLRQVLTNLVSNAIKFTEQGAVVVKADLEPQGQLMVRFEVSDQGIGIAPEAQEHIFDAFSQADSSTTRKYGGTGLGLAICGRLVEQMDGKIGVNSVPGQGSTFWFTVHLLAETAGQARSTAVADQSQPKLAAAQRSPEPWVLVAEDNEINQRVVVEMLKKLGCHVDLVANGKQALEALATQTHALVLMDCQMPEMDGYEAVRRIREKERAAGSKHIPIIAMTAHVMSGDVDKCLAAGMDDYLPKPFRFAALEEKLGRWLPDQPASHPYPIAPARRR